MERLNLGNGYQLPRGVEAHLRLAESMPWPAIDESTTEEAKQSTFPIPSQPSIAFYFTYTSVQLCLCRDVDCISFFALGFFF
jgi:hypothetical protein